MPDQGNRTPASPIDLTRVTETTRRALYDAVVEVHFRPTPEEIEQAVRDPENHWVPDYGPDAAGLAIYHFAGRWFAVWKMLETGDDLPEARRWEVLRIIASAEAPSRLEFYEV